MDTSNLKKATVILLVAAGVTMPVVAGVVLWRCHTCPFQSQQIVAASTNTVRVIKAEDVIPYVPPGNNGIQKTLPEWHVLAKGNTNGAYDPSEAPGHPGCYGLAWNVNGKRNMVYVFQDRRELKFNLGGWYTLVSFPDNVQISPADAGRIQADWNEKTYGESWTVLVLER
jgi:hypothetical protein